MQQESFPEIEHNKQKRLTPKELFQKHLQDPNHHVTDEELRNLRVGIEAEDEADVNKLAGEQAGFSSISNNMVLPLPYSGLK